MVGPRRDLARHTLLVEVDRSTMAAGRVRERIIRYAEVWHAMQELDGLVSGAGEGMGLGMRPTTVSGGAATQRWIWRMKTATVAQSARPAVRTELNVRDSDATVILSHGTPAGGTALTEQLARRYGRLLLLLDLGRLDEAEASATLRRWLERHRPLVVNVAGARQSEDAEIYAVTRRVLVAALEGYACC